jgi:hypothetical protein
MAAQKSRDKEEKGVYYGVTGSVRKRREETLPPPAAKVVA